MNKLKLTIIAMMFTILASCGTIFSGTDEDITFDSNVENVEVWVNGFKEGQTP